MVALRVPRPCWWWCNGFSPILDSRLITGPGWGDIPLTWLDPQLRVLRRCRRPEPRATNQREAVSKCARRVQAVSPSAVATSRATCLVRVGAVRASILAATMSLWDGDSSTKIWFTPGSREVSVSWSVSGSGQGHEMGSETN